MIFSKKDFLVFFSNADDISCPRLPVWHLTDLKREESGEKKSIIKRHIYSSARLGPCPLDYDAAVYLDILSYQVGDITIFPL